MAVFTQYAVAAAQEALDDACWAPKTEEEREMTVCDPFLFKQQHITLDISVK